MKRKTSLPPKQKMRILIRCRRLSHFVFGWMLFAAAIQHIAANNSTSIPKPTVDPTANPAIHSINVYTNTTNVNSTIITETEASLVDIHSIVANTTTSIPSFSLANSETRRVMRPFSCNRLIRRQQGDCEILILSAICCVVRLASC